MRPGQRIADRYTIEAQAGAGGMSTVYRALDAAGQRVALKVMLPGSTEHGARFTREARLLMDFEHPAIMRCLDTGITADGRRFMVTEWLDGVDLGAYVGERRFSVRESLTLVARMAEALATVHEHGVVHRDVKPGNIFLPHRDISRAKLLDFGIAYWSSATRLTVSGAQMGTPSYMAPEQIRGDDVDARADIFSLGCVLYLCLSGEPAYAGRHLQHVFCKILMEEPPQLARTVRGLPRPVLELVSAMMAKDRDARPGDAAQLGEQIGWIQAHVPLSDEPAALVRDAGHEGAITEREQRLVSVVAVADHASGGSPQDDSLKRYESLGARFEYQADGVLLGIFDTRTAATDQADDAARCALDMHASASGSAIVVATGRAEVDRGRVQGEVIDRMRALLVTARTSASDAVCVCEVTAGLVEQRFEIERDTRGDTLVRERYLPGQMRVLGNHTPFIGRAREIAALQATLLECVDEPMARAALITGPMGIGKSRLAQHFVAFVSEHHGHVAIVQASGDPMRAGSPLALLAQVIRGLVGIQEGTSDEVRRTRLAMCVRASLPAEDAERVAMFLGELIRTPWPEDSDVQLRAARRDPQLMGEQLRRAAREFLLAETARQPVLLVLDNLHWSDQATMSWVGSVMRPLESRPLMVVGVGRERMHEQFPDLWSMQDLLISRLSGISPRSAARLVHRVLGAAITDDQVSDIVERADGNPLYLEELIRSATTPAQRPDTVLAMMHVRLQRLSDMPRRLLRAASVVGDTFWRGCVAALCRGEVDIERELRWLTEREFLVESRSSRFSEESEYRFRHDLLREAAYGMLTAADRRRAHRLVGQWLEGAGETDALVIAEHLERGDVPGDARPLLVRAAIAANQAGDPEAAEAIAARGLSLGARDETYGLLRAIQAKAHQWRGQLELSLEAGLEALARLPDGSRTWYEVAEDVVAAQSGIEPIAKLEARAWDMAGGCPPGHDVSGWLIVGARLSWMLFVHGKPEPACSLLDVVERESGPLDDLEPTVAAHIHATRACRAWFVDRNPAGLLRELRRAVARYDEAGDVYNACDQRANVGYAETTLGLYEDAEATLRRALSDAQEMKIDRVIDLCQQNASLALCQLGRLDEARALALESVRAQEARGDVRLAMGSRIYLSSIALMAGDPAAAEEQARRAVSLGSEHSSLQRAAEAARARALLAGERPGEALDIMEKVMRQAGESEELGDDEMMIRLTWAETLDANGEHETARHAIGTARARLLRQAENIDDATWRQQFLYRVAYHARILALADPQE